MEKEVRNIEVEYRLDTEKRIVEGRAIPFNVFSPNREGFKEMIMPEAVEGVIEKSDIFMLYNHDKSQGFLSRNNKGKGSLKIDVREDGVWFTFKAKKDNLSNYIWERLSDGELNETSWAFTVADEEWRKDADGVYERIIKKFDRLFDFSVVDNSYYAIPEAVGCKRFAELQEADRIAKEEAEKAEKERLEREAEEAKEAELDAYYAKLAEEYGKYYQEL